MADRLPSLDMLQLVHKQYENCDSDYAAYSNKYQSTWLVKPQSTSTRHLVDMDVMKVKTYKQRKWYILGYEAN